MSRRLLLAVAVAVLGGILSAMAYAAAPPVQLDVRFDSRARLGGPSAMWTKIHIDTRQHQSFVTDIAVFYPKGLGITSSGLGLASCSVPPLDFQLVLILGRGLGGCSPDAVIAYGTAISEVRLINGQVVPESAKLTMLTGQIDHRKLGLVAFVQGYRVFIARTVYSGEVRATRGRFGGTLMFHMPAIPAIADLATVALKDLRMVVGSRAITYYSDEDSRTGSYHPEGVAVPEQCPPHGFRFRVKVMIQDGEKAASDEMVRCPLARPSGN